MPRHARPCGVVLPGIFMPLTGCRRGATEQQGGPPPTATVSYPVRHQVQDCKIRFRPILMTSFEFILGVLPLLVATGAGAEMRRSLGTAVFSGMIGVTLFGVFLTPIFFFVLQWSGERRGMPAPPRPGDAVAWAPERGTAAVCTSAGAPAEPDGERRPGCRAWEWRLLQVREADGDVGRVVEFV